MRVLFNLLIFQLCLASAKITLVRIPISVNMTLYTLGGRLVRHVVCDESMAEPLNQALGCIQGLEEPVALVFHGCYNYRYIAGTERLSQHAFGKAIDLNAFVGTPPRMVKCFTDAGFEHGGDWPGSKKDSMHFQLPKER